MNFNLSLKKSYLKLKNFKNHIALYKFVNNNFF